MKRTPKTSAVTRSDAERGRLVSALLAGAWRGAPSTPDFAEAELAEIAPLLCQTGSAALGWWRIRGQRSEVRGQRSEIRDQRSGVDRSVTEPGADRGPRAGSPRGVVDATGCYVQAGVSSPTVAEGSEPAAMFHEAYRKFRLSALIHEREIAYVFSLLRAEGIEPVLVKGWAIARLYPDRGLRPYGDIDLCVRPDQFAKAESALKCLESMEGHYVDLHSGFAKLEMATHPRLNLFSESRRPLRLGGKSGWQETHRRDAECAEVSQRKPFSRLSWAYRVPTSVGSSPNDALWDELFERSQLVSLGEEKIRVLSPEDHLRILCLHLLRSGAWRPLWLCDVAVALESRAEDFDWDRCLGSDPKIADWVACTIGVAQELLGAGDGGQRSEVRDQRSEVRNQRSEIRGQRSEIRGRSAQRELPRWLAPAILRQWGRSLNPHAIEPALPALSARKRDARKLFKEIYARWDQPVRATVALRGRFNNWPRWPYQLAELLLRSSEVPKQLASMFRGRFAARPPRSAVRLGLTEASGT